ncbi:MAG: PKD domain-containing protein [Chitinophagaceae bacterium]|nr:PKD domain-containing protein [Chitinophagaceae bacterium]
MRKFFLLTAILLSVYNLTAQKISPAGTTNICQNHTQDFTVTGGSPTSFQWQKDGVNINGATSASYTAGIAGVYRVIINGGKKQGDTLAAVTLVVNPNPKANFTFSPGGQCSSVPVFFTNSSQDGASYLWNFDDPNSGSNNTTTQKDPSHVFKGTPGNGTQTFNVKLITKTAAGCVDSITKPITIKQRPDASLGGTGSGKFNGDNYFSICGNLPTGEFNFSNQSTTQSTNTSYRIIWGDGAPDFTSTVFNTVLQHTYSTGTHQMLFIVSGQNGCIDTGFYRIYVGTNPAVGLSNPGNTAICGGSSLTFPITGIDNNPPGTIYTITFNDGSMPEVFEHPNIPASITHKFDKTSCGTNSSSGSTVYPNSFSASIRASNPCNSSEATIVPIYVSEKPNAKFVISPKDTICVDNIVTLTDSSKSSSVYNGTCTEGKIIWSISPATGWTITNGGILGNDYGSSNTEIWQSGSKTLKLQFLQPGVYTVKLKTGNAYCGLAETVQTICVNPKPSVAFAVDNNEGCAPFTVTTSTTANTPTCGENKYIWSVKYTAATECGNYSGKFIYLNNTDSASKNPVFQFLDPGTYIVSLVMLSPGGTCSTPVLTRTIVVKDKPRVEFNNLPDTICQYQSISPTASVKCFIDNSTTYLWSFPGATPASSASAAPGKVTFDNAGETEISLTVTNSCGATTITKKLMVSPTPDIEDIANITVCAGETAGPINITTNPSNATITWANSNTGIGLAASGSSATIPAFTSVNNTSNTITANITVNATLGTCSSTKNFSINVGARPETPTVQNAEYCLNASATPLTATAAPGNHLLWYNTATGGTGSTTAPTPSTTVAGITTYYVSQVSGSTNCESFRVPISVKVNPIPSITSATANNPVNCATATGYITLSGLDPSKNYQVSFTKAGIPTVITLQTNNSGNLIIPNLSAGLYTNIFVSLAGCPSNAVGPFTLSDPNPPDAPVLSSNAPLCIGSSLNLSATTSTTGAVTFKWTGPNSFTSSLQNPVISNVSIAASGTYYATVTQNNCTSATSSINIVVNALPAAPSTSPVSYCIDAVASPLTATGTSLLWYTSPTGGTGSSTAPTPDTHTAGTTYYYVSQTDNNGCESPRAALKVTIEPKPEAPIGQNVEYCLNAIAKPLTATASAGNYLLWYNNETGGTGNTSAPVPPTISVGTITYYVSQVSGSTNCESKRVPISVKINPLPSITSATITNPVNCATATGSITLTGLDPSKNYQVSFTKDGTPTVTSIPTDGSGNLTIPNLSAGSYTNIFVSLLGCPSNAVGPFTLSDPNPPDAPVLSSNSPICFGTTLNLGATTTATGPVSFKWTGPNGFTSNLQNPAITNATLAASGAYFVTVTQNNCTSATSTINVIVNALPAAPSTTPVSYCIDAVASPLTAIGTSLLWYTSPTGGTGSSTAPTPDTHISGTTDYFVTQTDNNGCESPRAILKVTIHPNAIAKFTPQKNLFCPPFTITAAEIGLQEYPANNSEYRWYVDGSYVGSGTVFPGFTLTAPNDSVTIKLVTNSLFGCKQDSMSYKFFTYKLPNPSFTLDNNDDCGPLSVLITNTTEDIGLYSYYWDFGNGQTSTQVQPGTITFNTNPTYNDTTYFIKLKMLSECDTITLTKSVHVSSKPKALFSPDITTGCSPMKVTFKNTSRGLNNTYYWDFGDGHTATTTSGANIEHTFNTGKVDTFNVRLIAANGCGNDTLQYAVIVAPNTIKANLAMNGPDHSGCLPHTVALINNSAGASSFQWDFGDGNFLSTSKNVDTVYHTYYNSGTFTISMRAQNNCSDTTVFDQVTVYPKPVAAFTTSVSRLCKGDVVSFTNQSSLATSYQWHFGDGTTSVLENPTHTYTTPGIYKIKLLVFKLNAPGSSCIDSTEKTIEVVESLPGTFTMSDSVATCAPLTVRFSNPIRPSVTAHWDFGDGAQASGDEAAHIYQFAGTYSITLTVTVPGGCTYKTTKTVTVNGPSGKLKYTGGNICSPGPVRFEADAVNTNTYHWDFGDGVTQTTAQPVVYHSYENPGNYIPTLILKNTAGCAYPINGIDTIKVDRVDADFKTASDLKCGSTTLSFSDNSFAYSGKNLVWWDFGDGTQGTGNTVSHTYTSSGSYNIRMIVISNTGCSDTLQKTLDIHVNNFPVTSINADDEACANLPVRLSGIIQSTDAIGLMQWELSNGARAVGKDFDYVFTQPGTYQIRFITGTVNGCYDTANHTITIKPSPTIKASQDLTICKGTSAQLSVSGAIRYEWTPLQGLSCYDCATPIASPDISTPYIVAGYNSIGCPDYDTVHITVIPPLKLKTSGNDSICIGQSANLLVSGAASYKWSPSVALSSTVISNPVANPSTTTTYRVIGYDGHNCFTDTAFITVAVGKYPTIDLGPDQTLPTGTMLPLKSVVENGPVKKWMWTPATDLDCANCPEPIAHIKKDITYAVEITSVYNCKATDTIQIKVFCKSAQVFIPNAFTPDGDGINDILMVRASGIASVKSFRVFNRWGQLVFERNNFAPNEPTFGWDGRIRGVIQPPGVYVYTAEVICENGISYTYKGNTTILK